MKKNRVQKFAKSGHEKEVVSKNSQKMDMKRNRVQKSKRSKKKFHLFGNSEQVPPILQNHACLIIKNKVELRDKKSNGV